MSVALAAFFLSIYTKSWLQRIMVRYLHNYHGIISIVDTCKLPAMKFVFKGADKVAVRSKYTINIFLPVLPIKYYSKTM